MPTSRQLVMLAHKIAIHAILASDIMFVSRFYRVIDTGTVQPLLLGILAATAFGYTALAVFERRYIEVTLMLAYVALVTAELVNFSSLVSTPLNPNAGFQYALLTNFVAFGTFISEGLGPYIVRNLLRYTFGYTILYVATAILYQFHLVPREIVSALLLNDPERGERLFNYSGATTFAWFYFLSQATRRPRFASVAGALVCGLAIALTLSRVYIACIIGISALWLVRFRLSTIRTVCLAMLWVATLTYLYGLLEPTWNPFTIFAGDTSGSVRAEEYEITRYFVGQDYLWGAGIPSVQTDVQSLTGNFYFAAGDLGTFGVWMDLGVFGFCLFLAGSHIVCRILPQVEDRFRPALVLTGCLYTSYACISPQILYSTGGTFFAIMFAYTLTGARD